MRIASQELVITRKATCLEETASATLTLASPVVPMCKPSLAKLCSNAYGRIQRCRWTLRNEADKFTPDAPQLTFAHATEFGPVYYDTPCNLALARIEQPEGRHYKCRLAGSALTHKPQDFALLDSYPDVSKYAWPASVIDRKICLEHGRHS
jgi:hypothetical protein